jgi:choline kinase
MLGVILAAGTGSRLKGLTAELPKALVEVAGRPLLTYALEFSRLCGCQERVVVTGAHAEKVRALLERLALPGVRWVHNPDYLRQNLYSLGAARPLVQEGFLLQNTDHVYDRRIAERVLAQCGELTAFCDTDRTLGADDMKVERDDQGRLKAISKQLTRFDRGYVGMTFCPTERLQEYFEAFDQVAAEHGDRAVVEMILGRLAGGDAPPRVGDVSGPGWLEVDTPEERHLAEQVILTDPARFPAAGATEPTR